MKSSIVSLVLVTLVFLSTCTPVLSQEVDPALTEKAKLLIERLGNADFQVREDATKDLIEIGEPALTLLKEAALSDDPEVSWRANKAILEIEDALETRRNEPPEPKQIQPGMEPGLEEAFRDLPIPEEMRKRMEEMMKRALQGMDPGKDGAPFFFREFNLGGSGKRTLEKNDSKYEFETDEAGAIKGTVTTVKDGEAVIRKFAFESEDVMKEREPELHAAFKESGGRSFTFQRELKPFQFEFGGEGFEDARKQLDRMRKEMERAFGGGRLPFPEIPGQGGTTEKDREEMEKALDEARKRGLPGAEEDDVESFAGLSGKMAEPALRAQLDLPEGQGFLVSGIEPGTEADRWGFQKWDLILATDAGLPIDSMADFRATVQSLDEGETILFQVIRRGTRAEVTVAR